MNDGHTNVKEIAVNGCNTVINKGTFISNQSLVQFLLLCFPLIDFSHVPKIVLNKDPNICKGEHTSHPKRPLFMHFVFPLFFILSNI